MIKAIYNSAQIASAPSRLPVRVRVAAEKVVGCLGFILGLAAISPLLPVIGLMHLIAICQPVESEDAGITVVP